MASLGLGTALLMVLCVNAMLFLGQAAVTNLNPEGPQFYNCKDSLIGSYEVNNCANNTVYVLNDGGGNVTSQLPTGAGTITIASGNIFTDTFSAIANWFAQIPGLKYLYNFVAAPANFIKSLQLPTEMSFAIGAIWYGVLIFMIAAFFFGRDY